MISALRSRAAFDWERKPDERERLALNLLPVNGAASDGIEWLAALAAHKALDVVGFILARGWILLAYGTAGSRAAITQRGIDALR